MQNIELYKDRIANPIEEIQLYLREISKYIPEISLINPDGIYTSKTREAVTIFQRIFGLPQTGIVDLNTWNEIVNEYERYYNLTCAPKQIGCFPSSSFEATLGKEGDIIYYIQILLNKLNKAYKNYLKVNIVGVFDQETLNAIKQLQAINKLPITGVVDKKTWDTLANLNNLSELYKQYP